MNKNRPKHLALFQISLPLPGWISIMHRISGALLFLALPLLLWLLQASLYSAESYATVTGWLALPLVKLALLGLMWVLLLHLCAGVRFLIIDLDIGVALAPARASSRAVLVVSVLATAFLGARLW